MNVTKKEKRIAKIVVTAMILCGVALAVAIISQGKDPKVAPTGDVAYINKVLHDYRTVCNPVGKPTYSITKDAHSKLILTQQFRLLNRTLNHQRFAYSCEILMGPSRYAEKKEEQVDTLAPNSVAVKQLTITWNRIRTTDATHKYEYSCGCKTKPVFDPKQVVHIPAIPENY